MEHREFDIRLRVGREPLQARIRVPTAPLSLLEMLPIVQRLSDAATQVAQREASAVGRAVRCGPGCGACCRQLVPIAIPEAVGLLGVVDGLEAGHRRRVEARFQAAGERLRSAGLEDRVLAGGSEADAASRRALGLDYFALGIACPFLEDESCSIYEQRPLACREYLVTSDPSYCQQPRANSVQTVEMPQRFSLIFRRFVAGCLPRHANWMPLILALDDRVVDRAGVEAYRVPGHTLLERFLQNLIPGSAASSNDPRSPLPPRLDPGTVPTKD